MSAPEKPKRRPPVVRARRSAPPLATASAITMYGSFPRSIIPLRNTSMALVTAFGQRDDGSDVMVPLVDFQLHGARAPSEGSEIAVDKFEEVVLFSGIVAYENLAFLVQDIAGDLAEVTRILAVQSGGGCKPDASRVRYSAQALRKAAARFEETATRLEAECFGDRG